MAMATGVAIRSAGTTAVATYIRVCDGTISQERERNVISLHPSRFPMTMGFHKSRYASRRGPADVCIRTKGPRDLRTELLALSVAMEEPMHSVVLRAIE
jgi:hypothetical protein